MIAVRPVGSGTATFSATLIIPPPHYISNVRLAHTMSRSSKRRGQEGVGDDGEGDSDLGTPLLAGPWGSRERVPSSGLQGVHQYDQEGGAKVGCCRYWSSGMFNGWKGCRGGGGRR